MTTLIGGCSPDLPVAGPHRPAGPPADAGAALDCSSGDPARGRSLTEPICIACHTNAFVGQPSSAWPDTFHPNLTPWNLGTWTDQQVADAVRLGRHPSGRTLCSVMPRMPLDDAAVCDLIAFLRRLDPIEPTQPGRCIEH